MKKNIILTTLFLLVTVSHAWASMVWNGTYSLGNNTGSGNDVAISEQRVVAVWLADYQGYNRVFSNCSVDGGATWNTPQLIANNAGFKAGSPRVVMSGNNVVVAWEQSDGNYKRIYTNYSTDGGMTWHNAQLIDSVTGYDWAYPQVAISGNNVVVTWSQSEQSPTTVYLYSNYSTDGGATWHTAQLIDTDTNDRGLYSRIVFAGSNVVMAWAQNNLPCVSYSTDNGATWHAKQTLGAQCGVPSIAASGNNVVAVWGRYATQGPSADVASNYSTDGGATWHIEQTIGSSSGTNNFIWDTIWISKVTISGNDVVALWSESDETNSRMYSNYSNDAGATWHTKKAISDFDPTAEYDSQVVLSGNNVVAVWSWWSSSDQTSKIMYNCSRDKGVTWEFEQILYNDTTSGYYDDRPKLHVSGNNVVVIWRNGTVSQPYTYNAYFSYMTLETPTTLTADLNGNGQKDVVIDFGNPYGIWIYYDNSTWQQLHNINSKAMATGSIDGDASGKKDLIIDFGADYGIWIYYNNATWQQLHNVSAKSIVTADLDNNGQDEIIIDFGSSYGIWVYYNNSTWIQLHTLSADGIVSAHENGDTLLCIDFGPSYGIWNWHPPTGKWSVTWSQLHTLSPETGVSADIDNDGWDEGIVDFGSSYGIWIYEPNGGAWSQLHTVSPESITVGNIDTDPKEDLIIDFGTDYGIWIYANNSAWSQLHTVSPDSITSGDLNGNGIDELIIDFGPSDGVWVHNDDGTWWQLHTVSP